MPVNLMTTSELDSTTRSRKRFGVLLQYDCFRVTLAAHVKDIHEEKACSRIQHTLAVHWRLSHHGFS